MTAAIIDFTKENSIEIGASFSATIQLSDTPDLTPYTGVCHVRVDENSTDIIITPTITINSHDTFTLSIPFTSWTSTHTSGNFKFDVLFTRTTDRFYGIKGLMTFTKGVTKIV
jgi:hypothetical protein